MAAEFSWDDLDDEELVTPKVQAVAVYFNQKGDIVIRQQGDTHDDDEVIVLPVQAAEKLMRRLGEMIEESRRPTQETLSRSKDVAG